MTELRPHRNRVNTDEWEVIDATTNTVVATGLNDEAEAKRWIIDKEVNADFDAAMRIEAEFRQRRC